MQARAVDPFPEGARRGRSTSMRQVLWSRQFGPCLLGGKETEGKAFHMAWRRLTLKIRLTYTRRLLGSAFDEGGLCRCA